MPQNDDEGTDIPIPASAHLSSEKYMTRNDPPPFPPDRLHQKRDLSILIFEHRQIWGLNAKIRQNIVVKMSLLPAYGWQIGSWRPYLRPDRKERPWWGKVTRIPTSDTVVKLRSLISIPVSSNPNFASDQNCNFDI